MLLTALLVLLCLIYTPATWARNQASLGDFTIDASRVPDWYAVEPADTSKWTEIDLDDGTDMTSIGCSGSTISASNLETAVQCFIDNAPSEHIALIPAGSYNVGDGWHFDRSSMVLRGAGRDSTSINFTSSTGTFVPGCRSRTYMMLCDPDFAWSTSGTSWTAGYSMGTRILTVASVSGLVVGDYVILFESQDGSIITDPQTTAGFYLTYISKLTCVGTTGSDDCSGLSANQIKIDRSLRHDFGRGSSSGQEVREFASFHADVGIERINFTDTGNTDALFLLDSCIGCWFDDVKVTDWGTKVVSLCADTARSLYRNMLVDGTAEEATGNRTFSFDMGCHDNVLEHSASIDSKNLAEFQMGSSGNVVAYSYHRVGVHGCNFRSIFYHGNYARENLAEGNDVDCAIETDSRWGQQGPRNTIFRNREASTPNNISGRISAHKDGPALIAQFTNYLGNFASDLVGAPQANRNVDQFSEDTWLERNMSRGGLLINDPCCVQGTRTTSVSNATGDTSPGTDGWPTFDAPDSLIYSSTPEWWCEEACDWAGETGIGAFGDDFGGTLCKLPAQIRAESGTCTAVSSTTPGSRHEGVSGSGSYSLRWPTMQEGGQRPASVPFAAWLRRMVGGTAPSRSFGPESSPVPSPSPDAGSGSP